ncbi:Peptidase aspartic putative domain-containing protein [Camponotus japonicus]
MDPKVKAIVAAATELYGKIARSYQNLMKLGSAKVTLGAVEVRLQNLEKLWTKFDTMNDELVAHIAQLKNEEYMKQDVPALAEEVYLVNKGLLLDLKSALHAKVPAPAKPTARTTLLRIQLPTFSEKYEDWPAFRDLFKSIIGKDTSTSPVEKLHYLKTCLKGEAELLIRSLTTTDENFERAWKILSDYYENKRLLIRSYLANFLALPKMKSESAVEMRKVFHGIKATVGALEGIGRPVVSSEDLFVYLSVELLDPRSRRE